MTEIHFVKCKVRVANLFFAIFFFRIINATKMPKFALISQNSSKFYIFFSFLHFFCLMWLDWDDLWVFQRIRTNSNNFCEKHYTVKWGDIVLNSRVTMNSHTLSMETRWKVPTTATSQDVYVLDCLLKFFVPQPQNFWNVSMTFWPSFLA